jgi:hypothetical protein
MNKNVDARKDMDAKIDIVKETEMDTDNDNGHFTKK